MRGSSAVKEIDIEPASSRQDVQDFSIAWDDVADCRRCAMREQSLFSALRGSDFEQILVPVKCAIVPAGTTIYREDAAADAVYTVRWGLIKLIKRSPEGTTRIVRLLGTGAAVGLESLKAGVYWHTAAAMQQTGLCRVPFKLVDALQTRNALLEDRLIAQWGQYMSYADRWIVGLSVGPVKTRVQRLIELLLEITDNGAGEIEMPSLEDLGAILGTSQESVSRAMAELKRAKVLTRIAPRTYSCDYGALRC